MAHATLIAGQAGDTDNNKQLGIYVFIRGLRVTAAWNLKV